MLIPCKVLLLWHPIIPNGGEGDGRGVKGMGGREG